jgi:hypothetical protein
LQYQAKHLASSADLRALQLPLRFDLARYDVALFRLGDVELTLFGLIQLAVLLFLLVFVTRRLTRLINQVLDLSRLESEAPDGERPRVDFLALIELLKKYRVVPVGVHGGSTEHMAAALAAGLYPAPDARIGKAAPGASNAEVAAQAAPQPAPDRGHVLPRRKRAPFPHGSLDDDGHSAPFVQILQT